MELGVLLESPQGSQSSSRVGACTCSFLPSCNSSVTLPWRGSRDLWLSHEAFPQGFPTRLSHKSFPRVQGRDTIPRVPQMSQSIPGKPVFPALPRLSSSGSTFTTVARGTALWESLVGKSHGKASRESHRSLDPREGERDTAATVREETHVHVTTRDEDWHPWGDSRSTSRFMSALERNPQVPAPTPHKVLGPGIDGRGMPRDPRATRMGTGLS